MNGNVDRPLAHHRPTTAVSTRAPGSELSSVEAMILGGIAVIIAVFGHPIPSIAAAVVMATLVGPLQGWRGIWVSPGLLHNRPAMRELATTRVPDSDDRRSDCDDRRHDCRPG